MTIKPEEITRILKDRIEGFQPDTGMKEVGTVLQSGDGIARVYGLENAMAGEMLRFPHGVFGIVLNLERENVGVVLLGEHALVKAHDDLDLSRMKVTSDLEKTRMIERCKERIDESRVFVLLRRREAWRRLPVRAGSFGRRSRHHGLNHVRATRTE